MNLVGERVLMRIYLQSADRAPRTPSYQLILKRARGAGLAGVTVLRGIVGYGDRGMIQRSAWSVVEHVPVIVEIVDEGERLVKFLEGPLGELLSSGMVTLERAKVMMYRDREPSKAKLELGALLEPLSTVPEISVRGHMRTNEPGVLLRIFIGESDRAEGELLYEAIVGKARELGLAGATVLRGSEGFGARSVVHKSALLDLSSDLPIVIEIVDREEKVKLLLPYLDGVMKDGMITMEHVAILMYQEGTKN